MQNERIFESVLVFVMFLLWDIIIQFACVLSWAWLNSRTFASLAGQSKIILRRFSKVKLYVQFNGAVWLVWARAIGLCLWPFAALVVFSRLVEGESEAIAAALLKLEGRLLLDAVLLALETAADGVLGLVPLGLVKGELLGQFLVTFADVTLFE